MMTKINKKIAGFSLIEVLFAMVFLSVIVFGVIKLQTSNLTLSNTKRLELKAYSYASQGLEIVDALGAGSIPVGCPSNCYLDNSGGYSYATGDKEGLENDLFGRFFTYDDTDLTNAALVTMTVDWTDSSGYHTASAKRIILD